MKIELKEITIRELTTGYEDKEHDGVIGYNGKLDIRPPYQREFIYDDIKKQAVISTIKKGFPLNVMYWAVRSDGTFEVIDGQQRTISISQFIYGDFHHNKLYFHSLTNDQQEQILNYKIMVYFCEGSDSEKLDWFETINISGEKLTEQELRNAVFSGTWVTDAKRYFSKNGCAVYNIGKDLLNGTAIRQDYLETAIKWISNNDIKVYMSKHQNDANATELYTYIQKVLSWVKITFPKQRKEMKGIEWGELYNQYKDVVYDTNKLEEEITRLMIDEDVTKKSGIYSFVLTGKEKYLNIRAFTDNQKRESYERQKGICVVCGVEFQINEMEADHITPWHEGGKSSSDNCQMLCKYDNRRKSGI
jgi:hypothetical protein